jgi:hypothetical protein
MVMCFITRFRRDSGSMIHLNAIVSLSHLEPRERAAAPVGRRLVLRLVIDAHAQYEEQMLAHHFHLAEQKAPLQGLISLRNAVVYRGA